jgi:hypothetical protein
MTRVGLLDDIIYGMSVRTKACRTNTAIKRSQCPRTMISSTLWALPVHRRPYHRPTRLFSNDRIYLYVGAETLPESFIASSTAWPSLRSFLFLTRCVRRSRNPFSAYVFSAHLACFLYISAHGYLFSTSTLARTRFRIAFSASVFPPIRFTYRRPGLLLSSYVLLDRRRLFVDPSSRSLVGLSSPSLCN